MLGCPGLSVLLFLQWTFNDRFDFGGKLAAIVLDGENPAGASRV